MKIWVAVTDDDWFVRSSHLRPDEVNFWQPSGSRNFRALQPGELFLFKLHSPKNFIVGGGHFVSYSALPASLALKHTYGYRLRAAGMQFEDRQLLLGHKATHVTTHYSAADIGHLIAASEKVCDLASRKSPAVAIVRARGSASA